MSMNHTLRKDNRRDDVLLFPFADRKLVIAAPKLAAFWLRQGVVPDAEFIEGRPDEFVPLARA